MPELDAQRPGDLIAVRQLEFRQVDLEFARSIRAPRAGIPRVRRIGRAADDLEGIEDPAPRADAGLPIIGRAAAGGRRLRGVVSISP